MVGLFGNVEETFAQFRDWAMNRWSEVYGSTPPWSPADFKNLKKGWELTGDRARDYWAEYLSDLDPYARGHSPRKWASDPGRWTPTERSKGLRTPTEEEFKQHAAKQSARDKAREEMRRIRE